MTTHLPDPFVFPAGALVERSPTHAGDDVDYPVSLLRNSSDFAMVTDIQTAQPATPSMAAWPTMRADS